MNSTEDIKQRTFKIVNKRLEKLGLSPSNETTSLPELPTETPLLRKKKVDEKNKPSSIGNLETKSLNGASRKLKLTPSPNERDSYTSSDASEKKDEERSCTSTLGSNSTLTNVSVVLEIKFVELYSCGVSHF